MSFSLPDELVIEGVARAFAQRLDADPDLGERLLTRMAELRVEVMTPAETATMLSTTVKTLRARHAEWGLEKSVALGPNEPRYFRSQVMAALHAQKVKAREQKLTVFPRTKTPAAGAA